VIGTIQAVKPIILILKSGSLRSSK